MRENELIVVDDQEAAGFSLNLAGREKVLAFESALRKLPRFECPLKHYFVDGLYVREIFIPAGVALVGYIHTLPCVTIVSSGAIWISDGASSILVRAPFTKICTPGSKKAGYAIEDTTWADAYANPDNEREIDVLEKRLTANTHEEYLERKALGSEL